MLAAALTRELTLVSRQYGVFFGPFFTRGNGILTYNTEKEGPIHDVTWNPNSKEFGVVYGYMPAKTTIFNFRGVAKHSFALGPRNTILFSPHGRFVLVAGFGNLAGQMDIYDMEKNYNKIATVEASNSSVCEWSPDGKYILTATTSPRLRVDNGVRIWHVSGALIFNEDMHELYDVFWRPQSTTQHPLGDPFNPLPTPHASALAYLSTRKAPPKPAGAYRPPGARGQVTPLAFKREDEGGATFVREGASSLGAGGTNGFGKSRRREVPGAEPVEEYLPPGAAPGGGVALPPGSDPLDKSSKTASKNKKKREAKKLKEVSEKNDVALQADGSANNANATHLPPPNAPRKPSRSPDRRDARSRSKANNNSQPDGGQRKNGTGNGNQVNGAPNGPAAAKKQPVAASAAAQEEATGAGAGVNPTTQDKKIRGLLKKIRAIDELKMRLAGGEKLEDTQMKKIQTEDAVRKELDSLGYSG